MMEKLKAIWNGIRFRYKFLIGGSLLVLATLLYNDPDGGISTGMAVLGLVSGLVAVLLAHWARKALFDYPAADMSKLFGMARKEPTGAGLALIAVAIVIYGLLGVFGPRVHAAEHDPRAAPFVPIIKTEVANHWSDLHAPHYLAGLIAHESGCPGMRSCWSPTAQLKTSREEGAGLGQLTRAYRQDGSLRFDSLGEMRTKHPALRELDWSNVYRRPDLQIRAVVLMSRDNWRALRMVEDPNERLTMTNAAYNGGIGGVHAERRACQMKSGCDPQRWWGHVELTCMKSRAILYGKRSACDINRDHSIHVMRKEMPKYAGLFS